MCLAISSGLVNVVHSPFHCLGSGPSGYESGEESGMLILASPPLFDVSGCETPPICWYMWRQCSHFLISLISLATLFHLFTSHSRSVHKSTSRNHNSFSKSCEVSRAAPAGGLPCIAQHSLVPRKDWSVVPKFQQVCLQTQEVLLLALSPLVYVG